MQEEINKIKEKIYEDLKKCENIKFIEEIKVKYFGKKGYITSLLKQLGTISSIEDRKIMGSMINTFSKEMEKDVNLKYIELNNSQIEKKLNNETIDISIDTNNNIGSRHPLSIVTDDLTEIFIGMGYSVAEGPDIEYSKFNFDLLNTPKDHPSRDLQDTFYITDDIVLRTQTSPVQARTMTSDKPPIKIISPGRVYRSDDVDATHSPMFHQFEGLVVDKGITMSDLKGTLELFAKMYFGEDTKIRLRPHHFPFTEPSAEVDVSCFVCGGKGCSVCKDEGWIEILRSWYGASKYFKRL